MIKVGFIDYYLDEWHANHYPALIGEVYHNCKNLYKNSTNATGKTYEMGSKISYFDGAIFATAPEEIKLSDGYVIAMQEYSAYPYVVAKISDCAKVTFKVGSAAVTEYWLGGETPAANSAAVKSMLKKNPAAAGNRYFFGAEAVVAGNEYTLTAQQIPSFTILASMTMHTGFDFNVYVPTNVNGVSLIGFYLDGKYTAVENAATSTMNGVEYYKISALALAPHNAAKSLPLDIVIDSNGTELHLTSTVSVLDYANEIFEANDQPREVKLLVENILKYIEASYVYSGTTGTPEYQALRKIYDAHKEYSAVSVVNRANADM